MITINVAIDSDGSVSGYTLDFAVTCGTLQANVTFTVNTANITVGENGMYLGGGVFGGELLTRCQMLTVMVHGK